MSDILPGRYERDENGRLVEIEPPSPAPEVMTAEEAARFLRVDHLKDPVDWLYQQRRKGLLRGTQIGRDIRYLRTELIQFAEKLTPLLKTKKRIGICCHHEFLDLKEFGKILKLLRALHKSKKIQLMGFKNEST